MSKINFENLIDKNKTQVFLFVCPGNAPFFNIGSHPWFVINKKGEVSRWEIIFDFEKYKNNDYLTKNFYPPFQGIQKFIWSDKSFWQAKLLGKIDGELAEKVVSIIGNSPSNYPYAHKYSHLGPNSNTYAKWILDQVPEWKIELPWNAFGRNYKK